MNRRRGFLLRKGQGLHAEARVQILDLPQQTVEFTLQAHQRIFVEQAQRLGEHTPARATENA